MNEWDRMFVLCYDKSMTESELNRLCSELYLSVPDDAVHDEKLFNRKINHYNNVKNKLRSKQIITLIINVVLPRKYRHPVKFELLQDNTPQVFYNSRLNASVGDCRILQYIQKCFSTPVPCCEMSPI